MSAIVQQGAAKINADRAGLTQVDPPESTASAPTFPEILTGIGSEYGGLSHLFGDGLGAVRPVETAVTVPTDSIRGRLGGLVPSRGSVVAPGPTVAPDSAKPTSTIAPAAVATAKGTVSKVRKVLGI